jgi:hypothetical protein
MPWSFAATRRCLGDDEQRDVLVHRELSARTAQVFTDAMLDPDRVLLHRRIVAPRADSRSRLRA